MARQTIAVPLHRLECLVCKECLELPNRPGGYFYCEKCNRIYYRLIVYTLVSGYIEIPFYEALEDD